MTKQIINLVNLLQIKDSKLNFYLKNDKFMSFLNKCNINKFLNNKLKLILSRKVHLLENNRYNLLTHFFFLWRLNIKSKNKAIVPLLIDKNKTSISLMHKKKQKSLYFMYDDFSFSIRSNSNLKYQCFALEITKTLHNCLTKFISKSFHQVLKFSHFNQLKSKMILFKDILLNKKLKFLIKMKIEKELRFYLSRYKAISRNISQSEIDSNLNKNIIEENSQMVQKNSYIYRLVLKSINKSLSNAGIRNVFNKWQIIYLGQESKDKGELLKGYKSIEEDFKNKLVEIEESYTINIEKIVQKNKEL